MKRLQRVFAAIGTVLLATTAFVRPALAQTKPIELVFASSASPKMGTGKAAMVFAKRAEELSGGMVKVKSFLGGTLYSEGTAVQAMKNGEVDLSTIAEGNIGRFTKQTFFLNLPYVFSGPKYMIAFLRNDPVGMQLREGMERDGFKVLAFMENGGFRIITNTKRPVKAPADMAGLKIRSTDSPVDVAVLKAFQASPTPIAWAETYNALEQGVVDGVHIPYGWNGIGRIFEVAKHVTEVKALLSVQMILMDTKRFNALPQGVQKALIEAGKEAEDAALKFNLEEVDTWRAYASKARVQIYVPNAAEMAQWKAAGRTVWSQFSSDIPSSTLAAIEKISK